MAIIVFLTDISQQKKANATLQENEVRLKTIVESAVDGIISIDHPGKVQTFNPAAERIFGYKASEVLGKNINMLMPEPFHSEHDEYLAHYLRTNEKKIIGIGREVQGRHRDGSIFPLYLGISEMKIGDQRMFMGTVQNITDRKHSEISLRESEIRLKTIVDSAVDGIISIDDQGFILTFNPAAEKLFGYRAEEVTGKKINMLMPEPYYSEHDSYLMRYASTGVKKIIGIGREVRGRNKDGSVFPIYLSVGEMEINGRVLFTGIIRDISEHEKNIKELQLAKETADASNQVKSEFLANISHEIRSPLNVITGMSEMLRSTALQADQRKYIDNIYVSSQFLLQIINDILDISRMEAGKLELHYENIDLAQFLQTTLSLFEIKASQKPNLKLQLQIDADMPAYFSSDSVRLRQILVNLLSNAIKFTEQGHISLSARLNHKSNLPRNKGSYNIIFSVSDTGIGIQQDKLHEIFESFTQAESTTTKRFGGTGLGLSICRNLVNLMGGSVSVQSTVGQGSVFSFEIELRQVTSMPAQIYSEPMVSPDFMQNSFRHILVVDDSEINNTIMSHLLKGVARKVTFCLSGLEAVKQFGRTKPDLVLLDIHMPKMDGFETLRRIRNIDKKKPTVPVIAVTADVLNSGKYLSAEVHFDGFVPKPINKADLYHTLKKFMR